MDDLPQQLDFDDREAHRFVVDRAAAGTRLDKFLADHLTSFSRAALQRLIKMGLVQHNEHGAKASAKLTEGDRLLVELPTVLPDRVVPQDLPLEVLLEEPEFVVLNKAPGIAVHPGRGRPDGTIANAIAFRWGEIASSDSLASGGHRPGIVHRLDLETSGAMVVARTERAQEALSDAFRERRVQKEYRALVHGDPAFDEDVIDLPLGRDVHHPTIMAVRFDIGRESLTRTVVAERFGGVAAHIVCHPKTGRTHQIRVHLQSRGHPLLGDSLYSRSQTDPVAVPRLMLHARRLAFPHPVSGASVVVEAPLPVDFEQVLLLLRELGA